MHGASLSVNRSFAGYRSQTAEEFNEEKHGLWTRGLLIRRNIADGDLAYFTTWCPTGTSIDMLVSVAGHRWAIEDSFETAKNEFGLDHHGARSSTRTSQTSSAGRSKKSDG
jgi:SRSO17 transposase